MSNKDESKRMSSMTEQGLHEVTVSDRRPLNDVIRLVPYNPEWMSIYVSEAKRIQDALGSSGEAFLMQVASLVPDVVLMDLYMPGGIDGIETTRRAREVSPNSQIVVLTAHTYYERVIAALRAGAVGYIREKSATSYSRPFLRHGHARLR